jgi:hypothetical protein
MMHTNGGPMSTQHHDAHSPADFDHDRALDYVRYRVLLAIPAQTYIPIFAIGVEARRSQCQTAVLDDRERWLAFPTLAQADDFVRENSRFGLTAIQVRSHAEYTARKAALEDGLGRGRFDLSRIEPRYANTSRGFGVGEFKVRPQRNQVPDGCGIQEA